MSTRTAVAGVRGRPAFERGARLGYVANGILNLVIGWLALQVAWGGGGGGGAGGGGEEASATGALRTLAGTPVGGFLLWVLLVGFALLGLWQLTTALLGGRTAEQLKAAGKGVVYLVLAVATYGVVGDPAGSGSSGSGGSSEAGWTADLMAQPLGRLLVGAVGLGVIAVGGYHVHKGWRRTFLRDLREHPGPWVVRAGRLGYVARGIAFAVVGALFVTAAATADPDRAQGLDGALQTLRDAPLGPWLLTLVALGFVAYGVYSFVRARVGRA